MYLRKHTSKLFAFINKSPITITIIAYNILSFYALFWWDVNWTPDHHIHTMKTLMMGGKFPQQSDGPWIYFFVLFISKIIKSIGIISSQDYLINLSIRIASLILINFYFWGCLKLGKALGLGKNPNILFSSLCVFIPSIQRCFLTIYPEIILISIFPWLCYYFIEYSNNVSYNRPYDNKKILIILILLSGLFSSQKITGILTIFPISLLSIVYLKKNLNSHITKIVQLYISISFAILFFIYLDQHISGIWFWEHSYVEKTKGDKASISFLTSFNLLDIIKNPLRNFQAHSMLNITYLELFGDYFKYSFNSSPLQLPHQWMWFRAHIGIALTSVFILLIFWGIIESIFSLKNKKKQIYDYNIFIFYFCLLIILAIPISIGLSQLIYQEETGISARVRYWIFLIPAPIFLICFCIDKIKQIRRKKLYEFIVVFLIICSFIQSTYLQPSQFIIDFYNNLSKLF